MVSYDVVIVGSGIAGASLAYFLSKDGFKTLVLDVKPFERLGDKPCGDAIGKHHFDELGLEAPAGELLEGYVRGIDVYSPSEKVKYRVMGDGYEVHRVKYTKYLLSEAINKGVEFWGESQGVEPLVKDGYVVGVSVWVKGRGRLEVGSKILVDASGMARAIVRRLDFKWPVREDIDPKDMNIAYREVRKLKKEVEEPEILRIYVSKKVAPGGYWWFFPYSKEGDVVNVGLGVQGGMNYPNPRDLLHEHVISREVFNGSEVVEAGGAAVPTRRPLKTLVWNGIAVTGDAAYAVNPVHGGGKGSAMLASWCISKSVRHALEVGDTSAKSLWEANICFNKRYGAKQAALDIFRLFLQRLSDEDLEYGMSKKIIKEEDLNTVSLKGDLELSVVEKAMRLLAGLSRPSLLFKLRRVAHYMNDVKQLYMNYPEEPEGLAKWYWEVEKLYSRFKEEV
ncbi:MAG: NAD(P)/FAD-dependent oxidoreductase [Desulfurococcaceae archaeon]|nr:NAD(P)/FAD-dependent oxidoreductase [Desulfurococcaceae archaeon]